MTLVLEKWWKQHPFVSVGDNNKLTNKCERGRDPLKCLGKSFVFFSRNSQQKLAALKSNGK